MLYSISQFPTRIFGSNVSGEILVTGARRMPPAALSTTRTSPPGHVAPAMTPLTTKVLFKVVFKTDIGQSQVYRIILFVVSISALQGGLTRV